MEKRAVMLNKIKLAGFPEKEVAFSIEDFFEGNDDLGSIGVNIAPQPSPKEFYETFQKIKSSPKTENVLVRISDIDDTEWFFTDTVYIIGDWTVPEIKEMLKELNPDEVYEEWMYGKPANVPESKNKIFSVWWD